MAYSPDFEVRAGTREVLIDGIPIALGARAFDVLHFLSRNTDRVVTKAEILEAVWGAVTVEEGNLSVQISSLRKALGPRAISTVPGVGYQLSAPDDALSPPI